MVIGDVVGLNIILQNLSKTNWKENMKNLFKRRGPEQREAKNQDALNAKCQGKGIPAVHVQYGICRFIIKLQVLFQQITQFVMLFTCSEPETYKKHFLWEIITENIFSLYFVNWMWYV